MIITAKYRSNHFTGYEENAIQPFSHYKSTGAFCFHDNQTKRQITIILAMFKGPNQATFLPSYGQIASMALEESSFESVNGRTKDKKWSL